MVPMLVTSPTTTGGNPNRPDSKGNLGFLRVPHHRKVPSPLSESISERFSTIIDSCQKRIKLLQSPFSTLNPWKRRRDRECLPQDQEDKPYLEETVLERNSDADLGHLVELPPGLGYEEWLASHTIEFFHHVNLLYGTVCEFCTLTCCPDMAGPGMRQYLWFDEKGKKTRIAAPQYVDYVMTFTQNTVNDESIFPTKFDSEFPSSFESTVKKIHRLLFHVIAHLYHSHFRELRRLLLHTHLNCLFSHFVLFNEKFKLIDEKETEILKDLIHALKIHPEEDRPPSTPATELSPSSSPAPEVGFTAVDRVSGEGLNIDCSISSSPWDCPAKLSQGRRGHSPNCATEDREPMVLGSNIDSGTISSEFSSTVSGPAPFPTLVSTGRDTAMDTSP